MAAYPAPPSYGAYDQQQPPQPGFGYPPNPSQPYYPPPPQPGYPQQPGYQPYQPGMQPVVGQPTGGYYPGQPPQTINEQDKKKEEQDKKNGEQDKKKEKQDKKKKEEDSCCSDICWELSDCFCCIFCKDRD